MSVSNDNGAPPAYSVQALRQRIRRFATSLWHRTAMGTR